MRQHENRNCMNYDVCLDKTAQENRKCVPCDLCPYAKHASIVNLSPEARDVLQRIEFIFINLLQRQRRWTTPRILEIFHKARFDLLLELAMERKEKL